MHGIICFVIKHYAMRYYRMKLIKFSRLRNEISRDHVTPWQEVTIPT